MTYTMEQYQKDNFVRKFPEFINDTKTRDRIFQNFWSSPTSDDLIEWFVAKGRLSIDKVLSFFSVKDIMSRFSPDERLEGLSPDEIQAYLKKFKQTSDD